MFVSALDWTRGRTCLRKGLLDFNLVGAGSDPSTGCLGSVDWRGLSALLAVSLLISGGAIPASRCRLLVLVGLRQPVMVRQALFRTGSGLLACTDLDMHIQRLFSTRPGLMFSGYEACIPILSWSISSKCCSWC